MRAWILLLALALLGCPPDSGAPSPSPTPTASAGPDAEPSPTEPVDPLEGSVFSQDELFAIYAAYQDPDLDARNAVLRKHRLVDAQGQEQAVRVKAFDQALETYASRDPEGWAEFVESLGR